jgi:hypothetical protein
VHCRLKQSPCRKGEGEKKSFLTCLGEAKERKKNVALLIFTEHILIRIKLETKY